MKTLLTLILLCGAAHAQPGVSMLIASQAASAATCGGNSWLHCRSITVDHTQVPSTLTNFTVLLNQTEADWAVTGSGGDVQNTVTQSGGAAITIPADWIITSDSACATPVAGWDFEAYNSATGAVTVFFIGASLSNTVDTVFYVCDDKAAVSTQQGTPSASWDSNYLGVWHLPQTSGAYVDSTSNANNSTAVAITTRGATGEIATAAGATGGSDFITLPAIQPPAGNMVMTLSAWVNNASWGAGTHAAFRTDSNVTVGALYVVNDHASIYDDGTFRVTGSTALSNSTWYHLVAVIDVTGGTDTLYVNGVSDGSAASSGAVIGVVSAASACGDPFGQSLGGICDEVRYSKTARPSAWVAATYNNQKPSSTFISVGARN